MGADDVAVDTGAMRASASHFDHVHGIAVTAYSKLVGSLNSIGEVWGSDRTGLKIEEGYAKPKVQQLDGLKKLTASFQGIAEMVRAVAKQHDLAEKIARGE
jgi:hypothetical protein